MRAALIAAGLLASGLPAHAVECSTSIIDAKLGDVTASTDVDAKDGKIVYQTVVWTPERTDGTESKNFARPALMLDYAIGEDGKPVGPDRAEVMISRFSDRADPSVGVAPPMSEMRFRATRAGADPLEWDGSDQSRGNQLLARVLKRDMPKAMTLQIVDRSDKVLASAEFDFSRMADVQAMMTKAKAATDAKVAAAQAAVAGGPPLTRCPAG